MPELTKLISMEEASLHNSKEDCWLVIDQKVYDVSSYLDDHPGGDDVVLAATGKDATEEFEDAGHTKSAKELMETFFIGELDTSVAEPDSASEKKLYAAKLGEFTKQYWVIPAVVLGVSGVVGFLHLRKK